MEEDGEFSHRGPGNRVAGGFCDICWQVEMVSGGLRGAVKPGSH